MGKAREIAGSGAGIRQKAVDLFYFVRDAIRYNPYIDFTDKENFIAGKILDLPSTFCVPKAVLLATLARAAGIPSRIRFATIRNNLVPEGLLKVMKTNIFFGHGFAELLLEGSWVKVTPSFDGPMCRENGYRTIEFDGTRDAILPATDLKGRPHIDYLEYLEAYDDLPFAWLSALLTEKYGNPRDLLPLIEGMQK
jgi:transglutaminase-like putative cysteine protease